MKGFIKINTDRYPREGDYVLYRGKMGRVTTIWESGFSDSCAKIVYSNGSEDYVLPADLMGKIYKKC